jgi:hypothetical protein
LQQLWKLLVEVVSVLEKLVPVAFVEQVPISAGGMLIILCSGVPVELPRQGRGNFTAILWHMCLP